MDTVLQVADSAARLDRGHIVESGRIVELLRDPDSPLGRALHPSRPHLAAGQGESQWFVTYTSAEVPADWPVRFSRELESPVSLLGASIETVNGATVGHASIGVRTTDAARIQAIAGNLGLQARQETGTPEADITGGLDELADDAFERVA